MSSFLGHTKNIYEILVFDHEFSARSPSPVGDFENPLGQHAVPSGLRSGPRARRAALGDFQNPLRAPGDLGENPLTKIRILPTNFM